MNEAVAKRTVLLVEDDADLRKVISENLELEGYHVICAARGKCAADVVERIKPDIALIDIGLPDINGIEVSEKMSRAELSAGTPVIIISGRKGLNIRLRGFLSGARKYLCKPFDMCELIESIEDVIRHGGVAVSRKEEREDNIKRTP